MKTPPGPRHSSGFSDDQTAERLARLLDELPGGELPQWSAVSSDNFGPDCPDEHMWQQYVAGRLSKAASAELLIHASECRGCGARLLFWSDVLSDSEALDERGSLDELACMEAGWQATMAQQMHQTHARHGGRVLLWSSLFGVAGAIAAGALLFLFLGNERTRAPERMLAEAYTSDRTMELRIPLAGYAAMSPPERTRGAGEAGHESVPLLEARAAITQALMKSPEDPKWLLLEARADLLNQNYDSAIDTLRRLEVQSPENATVLTDLASAYQQRADATDTATDRAAALDAIEHAARVAPSDPVVLYNEGLLLEQVYQYLAAVDAWKKYLAIERDPEWHADGQRHLDAVTARLAREKAKQSELAPYLASPDGMLHLARSPALLAAHDEELSTLDFSHLLQTAFPASSSSQTTEVPGSCDAACNAARSLLSAVADSLEAQHHDRWLKDLLADADRPGFAAAVNLLAKAVSDDQQTHFDEALHGAEQAQKSFAQLGNHAGALRAGLEALFADAHLLDDRACLKQATALTELQTGESYPWMSAHFWADESSCHLQQNDFAAANASLSRSLHISNATTYGIEHLRALGFMASNEESQGNRPLAWKMSLQGLRAYWNGNYPAVRKLQFYVNFEYAEDASERIYGAAVLHREITQVISGMDLPQVLAANQVMLARAEIRIGELHAGSKDWQQGLTTIQTSSDAAQVSRLRVNAESMLAGAYLSEGDTRDAIDMVRTADAAPLLGENREIDLRYSLVSGQVALLDHRYHEADGDLKRALVRAEDGQKATTSWQEREDWMERVRPVYASLADLSLLEGRPPTEVLAVWERYRLLASGANLQEWCRDGQTTCLAGAIKNLSQHLDGSVVLGAIRLDRSLLVWEMNATGVRFREIPIDPSQFDLLCHAFAEAVASPDSSESGVRAMSARLTSLLFGAFQPEMSNARDIVFDLDDTMKYLPVNALEWRGNYLGLALPISDVQSLLVSEAVSHRASGTGRSVVIGASVPARTDLVPLPEAKAEAIAVAAELPQAHLFTGRQATEEAVEAAIPDAALVHFAGHAAVASGTTRLMLAQAGKPGEKDGALDIQTLRRHEFAQCRLFVLSACSTGNREDREAGDAANVAQMLAADGVRQTVATHWAVDSSASTIFMKVFYKELAAGSTVSVALMEAERQVSAQQEYRHPYYWASYSVFGMSRDNLKELFHR